MRAAVGQETEFGRAQPSELLIRVSKPSPRSLEQIRITILTAKELGVDIAKEDYSMRPAIIPFTTTAEEQDYNDSLCEQ